MKIRVPLVILMVALLAGGAFTGLQWAGYFKPPMAGSTLARIKQEGVLRWGADPNGGAPFVFLDPLDPGVMVGFETELADRLAAHLGVKAELVRREWEGLVPDMAAGRMDIVLNGLEITEKRKEVVQFTQPYFRYAQQLTIRAENKDRYHSLKDLKGQKIAGLAGSNAIDVLMEAGWDQNDILALDDSLKPIEALKARRCEAVISESIIANYYAGSDAELLNLPGTFSPGEYGIAVRKEDPELLTELDRILKEMKESGELGELYQRWNIWNELQDEIGIKKGKHQEIIDLANPRFQLTWTTAWKIGRQLLWGAAMTLLLTVISMPLALLFGLVLALMVRADRWWLSWPAMIYIQVMRGTPLLVQIYIIFFGLPLLDNMLHLGGLLTWPAFLVGILCLSANYAAYEAEIHRAGLEAVPRGQREAALSLGMSESQAFFLVILPQSFRIILPPVFNDLISMLKDSCLVSIMGVGELLYVASTVGKSTFLFGPMLLAAGLLYLILSLIADWYGKRLEARLAQQGAPVLATGPIHH